VLAERRVGEEEKNKKEQAFPHEAAKLRARSWCGMITRDSGKLVKRKTLRALSFTYLQGAFLLWGVEIPCVLVFILLTKSPAG